MFVVIRMLPFNVAPYLACLLALMAPTLAQDLIEEGAQPAPNLPSREPPPEQPFQLGPQPIIANQPIQPIQPIGSIPLVDTSYESTALQISNCPPEQVRSNFIL